MNNIKEVAVFEVQLENGKWIAWQRIEIKEDESLSTHCLCKMKPLTRIRFEKPGKQKSRGKTPRHIAARKERPSIPFYPKTGA